jgi:twitching motility protein PilT
MEAEVAWLCELARRARLVHEDELALLLRGLPKEADLADLLRRFADGALGQDFPRIQRLAQVAQERARSGAPAPKMRGRSRLVAEPSPLPLFLDLPPDSEPAPAVAAGLMQELLTTARQEQASNVHITAGNRPTWRRHGELCPLGTAALRAPAARALVTALLGPDMLHDLGQGRDVSGAIDLPDGTRCRVSVVVHRNGVAGTFHLIPTDPCPLEQLGFNPATEIERLLDCHNGLVLVTGPAGSGKTSTLAALIDKLNEKRMAHVITIEDPIEILHPRQHCMISQRQLGRDTKSHAAALQAALREDPDVIVVGDMHDLATTELALTAAETGHLVLTTMNTGDVASALNRVLSIFPPNQANQIRTMVAESLRGVIGQHLLPALDGTRVLAWELLLNLPAVGNLIRDGRTYHIEQVMQTGSSDGMQTMDRCILKLFQENRIASGIACSYMRSNQALNELRDLAANRASHVVDPPQRRYIANPEADEPTPTPTETSTETETEARSETPEDSTP